MILYTINESNTFFIKFYHRIIDHLCSKNPDSLQYSITYNNSAVIQWKTKAHSSDQCISALSLIVRSNFSQNDQRWMFPIFKERVQDSYNTLNPNGITLFIPMNYKNRILDSLFLRMLIKHRIYLRWMILRVLMIEFRNEDEG